MPLLANAEQMSWGTPRSAKLAMRKLLVDIRQTRTFSWPALIVPVYRLPLSVVTSPAVVDLLGVLAYGELVAFERTAADASLAPTLEDKAALARMAAAVELCARTQYQWGYRQRTEADSRSAT